MILHFFQKELNSSFYDLLLLDVLAGNNLKRSIVFAYMFKKVRIKTIFKFLDEESTLFEDLKIITSETPKLFLKAIVKRIFKF